MFSNHYSIDLAVQWMISLWGLIYRHLLTPKMVSRLSYNSQAEAAAGDSSSTYIHTWDYIYLENMRTMLILWNRIFIYIEFSRK